MALGDSAETVSRELHKPPEARTPCGRLVIVWPPALASGGAESIALGPSEILFGRKPGEGGIYLADSTVSRQHVAIRYDLAAGAHAVRDLGSRNGSRLGGKKLAGEPQSLRDGDVLRIGDVLTVYDAPEFIAEDAPDVCKDAVFGEAALVRKLREEIRLCGADPAAVLLIGETGTGKEYIARELHRLSGRSGPFVAVNCAALSPQLIDSQLFGHARGAFTGALSASEGLFRAANEGTLLLDEIGELPAELQPKLLRALQEGEVQPVGVSRPVTVNVRVLAATLRELGDLAKSGKFRLDLYARLSRWEIRIPPLRRRRVDLVAWLERLMRDWHAQRGSHFEGLPALPADAIERLLLHDWPDNLRGLDRVVHRICGMARRRMDLGQIDAWLMAVPSDAGATKAASRPRAKKPSRPTKAELRMILEQNGGSVRATAKHFARDRRQIYRWIEHHGLRVSDEPGEEDEGEHPLPDAPRRAL